MIKLNLGCGNRKLEGFINADGSPHCEPDQLMDLEKFPWPFEDNSASHIVMSNVLEHVGRTLPVFKNIIQELYRVCAPDGLINIQVPDPYHRNYFGDPTHCRPVTPQMVALFSRKYLQEQSNNALTPIALLWDIDLETIQCTARIDPDFKKMAQAENIPLTTENLRHYRNVIEWYDISFKAIKPCKAFDYPFKDISGNVIC